MKTLKRILLVIIILVAVLFGYLSYSGLFANVKLVEKEIGPFYFVLEDYIGDYSKAGKIIDSLNQKLVAEGFETKYGFGIYRDNPENTPSDELRSQLGRVLEKKDYERIKLLERRGYKVLKMGKTKSAVVAFPHKTTLSMLLGVIKAYPLLSEHLEKNNYKQSPALEIYGPDSIFYSMQVEQ